MSKINLSYVRINCLPEVILLLVRWSRKSILMCKIDGFFSVAKTTKIYNILCVIVVAPGIFSLRERLRILSPFDDAGKSRSGPALSACQREVMIRLVRQRKMNLHFVLKPSTAERGAARNTRSTAFFFLFLGAMLY